MLQANYLTKNAVMYPVNLGVKDNNCNDIQEQGIEYIYHMTHIKNLLSILENGILSHNAAHQKCKLIDISNPTVNARRAIKTPIYGISLHNYVPCYFAAKNPMSYVLREQANDMVILKINPEILHKKGMIFSDGNAASYLTKFYNKISKLKKLNWRCIKSNYWGDFEDGTRLRSAEVLIPQKIKTKNIIQIAVNSRETHKRVLSLNTTEIDVAIQPTLFFRKT
jgi:hypothetical protein